MISYSLSTLPNLSGFTANFQCKLGNQNWWNRKIQPRKDMFLLWKESGVGLLHPLIAFQRFWKKFRLILALGTFPKEIVAQIYFALYQKKILLSDNNLKYNWHYNWTSI